MLAEEERRKAWLHDCVAATSQELRQNFWRILNVRGLLSRYLSMPTHLTPDRE